MAEITEENVAIDDHYLDLTLALRPLNSPPSTSSSNGAQFSPLGKREQQAIRRREAKERRDLKRKQSGGGGHELCGRRRQWLWGNAAAAAGGGCGPVKGQNGHFGDGGDENRSSVSSGTSSSAVSGGNSSDTSTHSSQQPTRSPALTIPSQSSTPNQPTSPQPQHAPLNSNNPNLLQQQLHSSSFNQTHLVNTSNQPSKPQTNEAKVVIGKPPKPNSHHTPSHESGLIPQMPCVTTTGDGPKGKTITGFLYKYTKAEVSIVCVCHGASFTPAGFVEHAGGVNVEHPLKHIRVAPFPL